MNMSNTLSISNTLPSLPNIDGALVVDNSSLDLFQTCPWLYYVTILLRRTPAMPKAALNFGGALHEALRYRYSAIDHLAPGDTTTTSMIEILRTHFAQHPAPANDHRQCELAEHFVSTYNKIYKREPWTIAKCNNKSIIEQPIMFVLGKLSNGHTLIYTGRIDLAVRDSEGLWVLDHKTTFEFGLGFEDDMRITPQMRGYAVGLMKILKEQPVGYIINAIRVRKPRVMDLFDPASGVRVDDFKRQIEHFSYHELQEWQDNTLNLVEELIWHHARGVFPLHRKSCVGKYGKCQLYDVCLIKRDQREGFLMSNVFETNDWTPLNLPNLPKEKEETKIQK